MFVAAIDIGTVTCRLLVCEVEGQIQRELAREMRITNLGIGVSKTGCLEAAAIERVTDCVSGYVDLCAAIARDLGLQSIPITAVATSAARDASNSDDLVVRLAQLGVKLNIIPGELEAQLSFLGASSEFPGERIAVVDVGGGSTEVIFGDAASGVSFAHSFNIGCRRITEIFIASDPPTADELEAARAFMVDEFSSVLQDVQERDCITRIVAVAGTATSVVSIDEAMEVYDSERVHKTIVADSTLVSVLDLLSSIPEAERKQVVGLEPKRAGVIIAGMLILQSVLDVLGVQSFTVSEYDILQGIIMASTQNTLI